MSKSKSDCVTWSQLAKIVERIVLVIVGLLLLCAAYSIGREVGETKANQRAEDSMRELNFELGNARSHWMTWESLATRLQRELDASASNAIKVTPVDSTGTEIDSNTVCYGDANGTWTCKNK